MFNDKADINSNSLPFLNIKLERVFNSDEEKQAFAKIKEAITAATDENEATEKVFAIGKKGVSVLIKLLKLGTFTL